MGRVAAKKISPLVYNSNSRTEQNDKKGTEPKQRNGAKRKQRNQNDGAGREERRGEERRGEERRGEERRREEKRGEERRPCVRWAILCGLLYDMVSTRRQYCLCILAITPR